MRNRITWKGFGTWLKAQKNSSLYEVCSSTKCPVAAYVNSVFKTNNAELSGHKDIEYTDNTGAPVKVKAPAIFSKFVQAFDVSGDNHVMKNKPHALAIYKQVSTKEGIV